MFCSKCGFELPDGAAFCQKCGTPQTQVVNTSTAVVETQTVISQVDEKQFLMNQMENSFPAMTRIKESEDKIVALEDAAKKAKYNSSTVSVAVGFAICAIVKFFGMMKVPLIAAIILGVIGGIAFSVTFSKKRKDIERQISEETTTLNNYKQDSSLSWLPYDYRSGVSFVYLYTYIHNLRANTLTEAINLFETEMHQARMEMISTITAQYAYEAKKSADRAADMSTAAAGLAAADAFFSLF